MNFPISIKYVRHMAIRYMIAFVGFQLLLTSCKPSKEKLILKAIELSNEKKYDSAIEIYSQLIQEDNKLERAYYNRGLCYMSLKEYSKALPDFNAIMSFQEKTKLSPFAIDHPPDQIPYNDAFYERAQVRYYLDSLVSSYRDFVGLSQEHFRRSICLVWAGKVCVKQGNVERACKCFISAKYAASTNDDKQEADKMLDNYCK